MPEPAVAAELHVNFPFRWTGGRYWLRMPAPQWTQEQWRTLGSGLKKWLPVVSECRLRGMPVRVTMPEELEGSDAWRPGAVHVEGGHGWLDDPDPRILEAEVETFVRAVIAEQEPLASSASGWEEFVKGYCAERARRDQEPSDLSWVALDTPFVFEEAVSPQGGGDDPWQWYRDDVLASPDNRILGETIEADRSCTFSMEMTVDGAITLDNLEASDIVEGLLRVHPEVDRVALTRRLVDLFHQHNAIFGLNGIEVRVLLVRTILLTPVFFEFRTTVTLDDWHGDLVRRYRLILETSEPYLEALGWELPTVAIFTWAEEGILNVPDQRWIFAAYDKAMSKGKLFFPSSPLPRPGEGG